MLSLTDAGCCLQKASFSTKRAMDVIEYFDLCHLWMLWNRQTGLYSRDPSLYNLELLIENIALCNLHVWLIVEWKVMP